MKLHSTFSLIFIFFCVAGYSQQQLRPPEFGRTLRAASSAQEITDAAYTLAVHIDEPAYHEMYDAYCGLLADSTSVRLALAALKKYPVSRFLPNLVQLLPSEWKSATRVDFQVLETLAELKGPTASGILSVMLSSVARDSVSDNVLYTIGSHLVTTDPVEALSQVFKLSAFHSGKPIKPVWSKLGQEALMSALMYPSYHGPVARVINDALKQRLSGNPGKTILKFQHDPATVNLVESIGNTLKEIHSAPAQSVLLLLLLSDAQSVTKIAKDEDYSVFADAPWLALDPLVLSRLISPKASSLVSTLKVYSFPSPENFLLATPSQLQLLKSLLQLTKDPKLEHFKQLPVQRGNLVATMDHHLLSTQPDHLAITTLSKLKVGPYVYYEIDENPLRKLKLRISGLVASAMQANKVAAALARNSAQFSVDKEFQLLALDLYSIARARSLGLNTTIKNFKNLKTLLDSLSVAPELPALLRSSLAELPSDSSGNAVMPKFVCKNSAANVSSRTLDLKSGQYSETLEFECDTSPYQFTWQGAIPFSLQTLLVSRPRLLDYMGISLAVNEINSISQTVYPQSEFFRIVMAEPEMAIPILWLALSKPEVSWKDVEIYLHAQMYKRDSVGYLSPTVNAAAPLIPVVVQKQINKLPQGRVLSPEKMNQVILNTLNSYAELLAAKENKRLAKIALGIIDSRIPDEITTTAKVQTSGPGENLSWSTATTTSKNPYKAPALRPFLTMKKNADKVLNSHQAFDLQALNRKSQLQVQLLRGWTTPNADRFTGVYLISSYSVKKLAVTSVRIDSLSTWARVAAIYSQSLPIPCPDFGGISKEGIDKTAALLTAITQDLLYAEASIRNPFDFPIPDTIKRISEIPFKKTEFGRALLREYNWQKTFPKPPTVPTNFNDKLASPVFSKQMFTEWDTLKARVKQNVPSVERQLRDTLNHHYKKVQTEKAFFISFTFGGGMPTSYGLSVGYGAFQIALSTNFKSFINVFPTLNGIGIPLAFQLNIPNPSMPTSRQPIAGREPLPQIVEERQSSSEIISASRQGELHFISSGETLEITGAIYLTQASNRFVQSLFIKQPNSSEIAKSLLSAYTKTMNHPDTPCNLFVQLVMADIFKDNSLDGLMANDMADFLEADNPNWEKLGSGASQNTLDRAQEEANRGKAVIAVYKDETGNGHVAIIIPGNTLPSPDWGLSVPNTAQARLGNAKKSWIGRRLSEGFGKDKKDRVLIYVKRY